MPHRFLSVKLEDFWNTRTPRISLLLADRTRVSSCELDGMRGHVAESHTRDPGHLGTVEGL